jgi:hypothetical protein
MTMHLLPSYYTTTRNRKAKSKVDASKHRADWLEYNKQMKRVGLPALSFDDYILHLQGKLKPRLKGIVSSPIQVSSQIRETIKYTSKGSSIGTAAAKPTQVYTGTYIKGVAVMHKSNSVPITSHEQATDIANMRR